MAALSLKGFLETRTRSFHRWVCVFLIYSSEAYGFIDPLWNYLKQYQFGVDYASTQDSMLVSYETATSLGRCSPTVDRPGYQTCSVSVHSLPSSGYGLVLQQAFRKQGKFYFRPDISFGARYLSGELQAKESRGQLDLNLPLRQLSYDLLAMVIKPYIQFGITPQGPWPDLLLSLGPAVQVALGQVAVNDKKEYVATTSSSRSYFFGFFEVEIVFVRFGDGAFSIFASSDNTKGGRGTKFYPKTVDTMDQFYAESERRVSGGFYGFGLKLLLNWP